MPENDAPVSKVTGDSDVCLAEHPDASAEAIAEALAAQGIQVSPALVAMMDATPGRRNRTGPPPLPEPEMPPGHIPFEEGKLFYKLYAALCSYANGKLNVVPGEFSDPGAVHVVATGNQNERSGMPFTLSRN